MTTVHDKLRKYDLILCSGSPRRLEILQQLGLTPRVVKSNFAEDLDKSSFPYAIDYVSATALEKVREVYHRENNNRDTKIFISADTVIIGDGEIFEKPHNYKHNVEMIKKFRQLQKDGKRISIATCGWIIFPDSKEREFRTETNIYFVRDISDSFIEEYCQSGEGGDVAGGFKIQGFGSVLFEKIEGDYYNCVGLPASTVWRVLAEWVEGVEGKVTETGLT